MDVVLGPDIYVNASVALGSPPEHAVRRAFTGPEKPNTSTWVMERVESMLRAVPEFKDDAVAQQMGTIRNLVQLVDAGDFLAEDWESALVALAKAVGVARVLTDHPDLVSREVSGIELISSDKLLSEQVTPPPPPGV